MVRGIGRNAFVYSRCAGCNSQCFLGVFTDKCLVMHRIGTILVNRVLMGGAREELLVT